MGRITGVRGDVVVRTPDVVGDKSQSSEDAANELLVNELVNLASKTFDTSRPVDEGNSVTSATTLEVLPEYEMDELIESIVIVANPTTTSPAPVAPAVPATTVAAQNVNSYPVTVVITAAGATITGVVVNALTVGAAAGTYTVPAYGFISIAFTGGPPTWAWTNAGGPNVVTLQLGRRSWAFTMSLSGVVNLTGLKLRLDRSERRIVTQPVAGPLSLELMGHADMQG